MTKRILIVDDSLYMRSMIKDALQSAGYEIIGQAANGESAIDMAIEFEPDLITLDNILPDMIGLDVLKTLKQDEKVSSKILMISAVGQESVVNEGIALGAVGYIVKPFTTEGLIDTVNQTLKG